MENSNGKTDCRFGLEVVSYLYGELAGTSHSEFEVHLSKCRSCAADLQSLSVSREAVAQWRDSAFVSLATPTVSIPGSQAKAGLFDRLRSIFVGFESWTAVAAAAGVVVVVFGLMFFGIAPRDGGEIARSGATSPEVSVPNVDPLPAPETAVDTATGQFPDKSSEVLSVKEHSPKTSRRDLRKSRPRTTQQALAKSVPTPKRAVAVQELPRLHEFDEEEEESLRLADLFAQSELQ